MKLDLITQCKLNYRYSCLSYTQLKAVIRFFLPPLPLPNPLIISRISRIVFVFCFVEGYYVNYQGLPGKNAFHP